MSTKETELRSVILESLRSGAITNTDLESLLTSIESEKEMANNAQLLETYQETGDWDESRDDTAEALRSAAKQHAQAVQAEQHRQQQETIKAGEAELDKLASELAKLQKIQSNQITPDEARRREEIRSEMARIRRDTYKQQEQPYSAIDPYLGGAIKR